MTDINIPPEALRAARAASMNARGDGVCPVEAACIAMLRSWPGMIWHPQGQYRKKFGVTHIILPLPQEGE